VKIALVCDWYHPRMGGLELHLQDLARRLHDAGHDVHVVTPTPGDAIVDGIRVHRTDGPRAPRFRFVWTPRALRSIAGVLARERFDVAHCHVSIVSPAAFGGALHAQRLGIPAAVTFHSVVPQTRLLAAGLDVAIRSSRWPAAFSAVSARVARDVQPLAGARTIRLLPNGIDHAFWRAASVATNSERPRTRTFEIVSVMRLNAKKRPLALIEMMRVLVNRLPGDSPVRLRIAGDGPLRARVERAIARHGLARNVELLGFRTRAELREVFAASDLFVLPTVRESFGLAALEARCAGLPVVAMAASGVAELIAHGREGLLARSDGELLSHVVLLASDHALRSTIAAHNRAVAPSCDWATVLRAHLELYSEAITLRASSISSA
jgi:glycosyltransferase involved in cell wall biosynthesis